MNERITFSVTLDRDTALHLQEMAHDGGLLLSEMAVRCLTAVAEDDRRAHKGVAALAAHKAPWDGRDDREDEAERRRSAFKVLDGVGDVRNEHSYVCGCVHCHPDPLP